MESLRIKSLFSSLVLFVLASSPTLSSAASLGINYGQLGNNLPQPTDVITQNSFFSHPGSLSEDPPRTDQAPFREQTSLLSIVKLALEILSLLVCIIALILAFRRLTTNNTGNIQTLPEGNVASTNGVTNSSNHDNIQLALNINDVCASNIL